MNPHPQDDPFKNIRWHPVGNNGNKPLAEKPPLNRQVLGMLRLIRLVEKHLFPVTKQSQPKDEEDNNRQRL